MELNQLKYFCAVAEQLNMTKAAESLFISQPSLSNSIARLERELGFKLFERSRGQRIRLSPYGRIFRERADNALREIDNGISQMREAKDGGRLQVRLSSAMQDLIPFFLDEYANTYRKHSIIQYHFDADTAKEHLIRGDIDMAITWGRMIDHPIEWVPLFPDETYLLVSPKHPLSKKSEVTLKELAGEKFVLNNSIRGYQELIDFHCKGADFVPNIVYQGSDFSTVSLMTGLNRGVSPLPAYMIALYAKRMPSLRALSCLRILNPRIRETVGVARLTERYMSAASEQFYLFLIERLTHLEKKIGANPLNSSVS